jgi:hypothetical protein
MNGRFLAIVRWLGRILKKHALSTTARRWTTGGILAGIVAALCLPAMGLALLGTAIAVWTSVIAFFGGMIGGVAGNAVGSNRRNRELERELEKAKTDSKAPIKVT